MPPANPSPSADFTPRRSHTVSGKLILTILFIAMALVLAVVYFYIVRLKLTGPEGLKMHPQPRETTTAQPPAP